MVVYSMAIGSKVIEKAQMRQKDKNANQLEIHVGGQVFMYNLVRKWNKAYKLSRPFEDPYWVVKLYPIPT